MINIFTDGWLVSNESEYFASFSELSADQLKNYLETTSKEQQEKDFFEICCKIEGIDLNLPNARKLLKRKQMKDKFLYRIFPKIIIISLALASIVCFIATGYLIGKHNLGTGLCMMMGMFSFTQFLKKDL